METNSSHREIDSYCSICEKENVTLERYNWFKVENFRGIITFFICNDCRSDFYLLINNFNKRIKYLINTEFDTKFLDLQTKKKSESRQLRLTGV